MTLETLRRSAAIITGLVGVGAFGIGCGKSDTPPTIASFCAQKAEKECGTKDKGVAHDCGGTVTACTTLRAAACAALANQQQSVAHPLRSDAIANCLNKTDAAYSQTIITPALRQAADDACARVFSGMGKVLTPCTSNLDCDVGLICDRTFCAMPKAIAANALCNNPGETCPANQYCAGAAFPQICTDKKAAGTACDAATPCVDTLRCVNALCVDKVATRGACITDADCAPSAPYCDPYNGNECFAGFSPASAGGTNECTVYGGPSGGAGGTSGAAGGAGGGGGTTAGAGGVSGNGGAGGVSGNGGGGAAGTSGVGGSLGLL